MNVSSVFGKARAGVLVGVLLTVAACAAIINVDTGRGYIHFHFEGYVGELPPGAKPLKTNIEVTVPGLGSFKVNVYDTNGDGVGDTAGPIPPKGRFVKGHLETDAQSKNPAFSWGQARDAAVQQAGKHADAFVIYGQAPENSVPVTFNQSVAEYLSKYGLDHIQEGENDASNLIDVLGASADPTVPSGIKLDLRLHWNTEAGWVDITQFPSLQYEFYGLADVPDTWPHYMVLRVVGDSGAVLNWLAHFGITQMDFYGVKMTGVPAGYDTVDHLGIEIDEAAGFAQVTVDDVVHFVPLNW